MVDELYKPGETVPYSGIFQVTHFQHRQPHEAVMKAGEAFPRCRICGEQTRFRMLRSASPIEVDRDFDAGEAASGPRDVTP